MKKESQIELWSQDSQNIIKLHPIGQSAKKKLPSKNSYNDCYGLSLPNTKELKKISQNGDCFNMLLGNPYCQDLTEASQVSPKSTIANNLAQQNNNQSLNNLVQKLLNDESFEDQETIFGVKKTFSLKLNDKKLYNAKWISRLEQIASPCLRMSQLLENFDRYQETLKQKPSIGNLWQNDICKSSKELTLLQKNVKTSIQASEISLQLRYPSYLKFLESAQNIKQKKEILQNLNQQIEDEDIQLVITYHTKNSKLQLFIEQPLDQTLYPSTQFSIRSYLIQSQIDKISSNFLNFWPYVKSKALDDFFLIRVLSLEDVLDDKVDNLTLLEKINALRRYLDLNKKKKDRKKYLGEQLKPNSVPSFLTSKRYQLHGNRQLLQQLWELFGEEEKMQNSGQVQSSEHPNIMLSSHLNNNKNDNSKSSEILKSVQFVPSLHIHQDNYSKFINQFTEIKRIYFNGMSVGFKGFSISNFTTRSQNNITFVFQDFHELPALQALLIDFQFQLSMLQQIQKEFEQNPKISLKKVRVKERFQSDTKPWVEDMFKPSVYQQNNKNLSFSIVDNMSMIKPPEPRVIGNRDRNTGNTSSVNSSFFLNSVGYCQNPKSSEPQSFRSKAMTFFRLDKQKPDYLKLIRYLNSIPEVSKTVIIDFERMFELFTYKNKLTSLINVCCNFDAGDLQLLPQPLEIVKVHEDYRANIVNIKDQVKELLENERKFACMNVPGKQMRINSINCFNIVKMNEEYQARIQLFKRIKQKYGHINGGNEIYNEQFQESISTVELILPSEKVKNQFVCFPFHNKTFKIGRYFEPGSGNLLDLQLKQTNEKSQNFIPSEETTFNQYKQRMIKQGVEFFYFSYPFGEKFKLNLRQNNIYSLGIKNEIKFKKQDHLRVMYWLSKINRTEYKLVFYEQSRFDNRREEHTRKFTKEKLPEFEQLYEFGFVDESLKQKIKQIQVYTGSKKKPGNIKWVFKKSIQKLALSQPGLERGSKAQKTEAYRILTHRSTWDFVLKNLKTICEQKQTELRRITISEQDDIQFQTVIKSLKPANY